jgi:NADP-dependent 3-hydroxy acid dehydrogenase YdfG
MASLAEWYRGKKVVITGASSGIGKDLALLLGEFGAHLALVARRRESMEEIREALKGRDGECWCCPPTCRTGRRWMGSPGRSWPASGTPSS